jgi:hypothetical protein
MRCIAGIAVALFALCAPLPVAGQAPSRPSLDSLAFMAGCWRSEAAGGSGLEEFYTAPSENLILGMSRFLRGGRAVQFEFSRITADSTGIVLLPFPSGRPSEHPFRMTAVGGGQVLFEAPDHDFPKRIRYTRGTDGSLTARIDGGASDTRAQEWRMLPFTCGATGT